ncbi:MAG: EamA family transporter [Patescibacteria group bacterium]|nr:EamA family transporter [Patescibacteria group bacterium]
MTTQSLVVALYGLGAATAWGSADYFGAKASRRTNPIAATAAVSTIGTLLFTIFFMFNQGIHAWNSTGILYAIAAGISLELGLLLFYRALNDGPVNVVSPVSSAYPLVTTAISILIFGNRLSVLEYAGIASVVIGIITATGLFSLKKSERKLSSGVVFALMTVVMWGVAFALIAKGVEQLGWQKATLVNCYSGIAVLPFALTFLGGTTSWHSITTKLFKDPNVIAAAAVQTLGGVLFSLGLTQAKSGAVITAIAATYPVLTIFLAIVVLKEKAVAASLVGSFITILGIVILSL